MKHSTPKPARIFRRLVLTGFYSLAVLAAVMTCGIVFIRHNGWTMLSVQSGSMQPWLHKGDAVLVRPIRSGVKVGDIVSYNSLEHPGIVITHRVIAIDHQHGTITTKGDALDKPDPSFPQSQLEGQVIRKLPYAGRTVDLLKRPLGLAIVVYVPILAIVADELSRLASYFKTRKHYVIGQRLG